jgi:hypothetical protein
VSEPRYWTLDEANAALPRVAELVEEARQAFEAHQERAAALAAVGRRNGHVARSDAPRDLEAVLAELNADGIVLRDPERGLIDFPALAPSGRQYWLCWLAGEDEVAWWHWPEDGFPGRKPLTDPPE